MHAIKFMECKKCRTEISYAVAAETLATIKNSCRAAGMSHEEACLSARENGPLCRRCINILDAGDNDPVSPKSHRRS